METKQIKDLNLPKSEETSFHFVEIDDQKIPLTSEKFSIIVTVPCLNCSKCYWKDGQEVCSEDCKMN